MQQRANNKYINFIKYKICETLLILELMSYNMLYMLYIIIIQVMLQDK